MAPQRVSDTDASLPAALVVPAAHATKHYRPRVGSGTLDGITLALSPDASSLPDYAHWTCQPDMLGNPEPHPA